jgi:hypothetical protein
MKKETATALLQMITDATALTFDAQLKLKALEAALKQYEPNLFACYQKEVEQQRKNPPYAVNLAALEVLQEKLFQDQ